MERLLLTSLHRNYLISTDRNKGVVTAWLKKHSHIQAVSRDSSKSCEKAILVANPEISQTGDRWHILEHLFDAVRKALFDLVPSQWESLNSEREFHYEIRASAAPL
ncbi:transposase [Domibacillus sp. PGB-M46]|uniref:transposase n=1 Tax=Domibacillus sp. PGB-M46 TaxID=2910255 RepID=UPI001F56A5D4|nr:transposase [Domibacillus sp. PGB-M46]MCI2253102.1 transposase [Domibacillus sp. PGB-M46]